MEILESRRINTSELSVPDLLSKCRDSSVPQTGPVPAWIREKGEDSRPVWIPRNLKEGQTVQALVIVEDRSRPDWDLILQFWNRYGEPNPVEKGRVLRECSPEVSERSRLLDRLDLPNAQEVLTAYRKLPGLPASLRQKVASGEVSARLFRYFYRIPEPLRSSLLNLIEREPRTLSVQDTRQLAEALRRMNPDEYDSFLEQVEPRGEVQNAREIGSTLLEEAQKRAYPELYRRRKKFEEDLEDLDLDGRIQVKPPKNFEGKYLSFSFRCERGENLAGLAEEVKKCQQLLDHV